MEGLVVMGVVLPLERFADEPRQAAEHDRAGMRVPVAAIQRLDAAGWTLNESSTTTRV